MARANGRAAAGRGHFVKWAATRARCRAAAGRDHFVKWVVARAGRRAAAGHGRRFIKRPWPGPVAGASVSVPMDTRDERPRSRDGDGDESRLRDVTDAGAIDEINIVLYSMSSSLVDVSELINAQVFTTKASSFNLTLGTSFDLRGGYDLGDLLVQNVWANLQEQKPRLIVGSPPCAPFSTLMALSPDSVAYWEKVAEGIRHLAFCMEVYAWQHAEGRLFLHEHPHGAWSWKEPYVVAVLELEGCGRPVHVLG